MPARDAKIFTLEKKFEPAMQDELALLRQENNRLKLLVNILSDTILEMRRNSSTLTGNVGYSDADTAGLTGADGKSEATSTYVPGALGKSEPLFAYVLDDDGKNETSFTHVSGDDGKREPPFAGVAAGSNAPFNFTLVLQLLSAQMHRCTESTVSKSAKILAHLHQQPLRASYGTLQHITSLSASGIAKHIMALKKRGLIVRTGFQHYELTPKSLQILERARV